MADANIKIVLSNGQEAGKTINALTAEATKLAREIKKAEEGSEQFNRATDDWKKVQGRLVEMRKAAFTLEKKQEDLTEAIEDTTKAQSLLNNEVLDLLPFNAHIQKLSGTYGKVTTSIKATTLGTNLLGKAMIALPLIGIIALITKLVSWFLSTQRGMDAVAKVTRPLVAIWERLLGIGQDLSMKLFSKIRGWIKDPVQAFKDLGQAILDNVINRFTALSKFGPALTKLFSKDWKEGLKDLGNAALQMGTGVENAIDKVSGGVAKFTGSLAEAEKIGKRINELTVSIEEAEINLIKRQAELALIYKESSEIAENTMASEKDRQAAAQRAIDATEERIKLEREFMDMRIERMQLEHSLNDTSRADMKELAELEAEKLNMETAAAEARTTARSKLNVALQAIAGQEKKAHDEAMKQAKEREEKEKETASKILEAEKTLQDQRIAMMSDEQDRRIAEINLAADREIEAFEGTEAQKTEFLKLKQQERDAAIEAIIDENNKKAAEKNLARLDLENQMMEEKVNEQFFNKLISEEERNEQLYELQKSFIEKRLALLVASGNTESLEYQKLYTSLAKLHADHEAEKTKNTEKYEKARADLQKEGLQVAGEVFGGIAELLSADEDSRRKNFAIIKALKMAELKVSFINELAGIWENANKSPLNAVFPGAANILAMVKVVAASARFGAGMVQVASAKFADGGPVHGPSHQSGGIPFSVRGRGGYEMEGDEIILSKGVYRDPVLRAMASDLNALGGGRRFALGGPVVDRGLRPTNTPTSTPVMPAMPGAEPVDMRRSEALLEEIAANTRKAAYSPVPLSIQRVRDGLNTLTNVENEAKF